MTTLAEIPTPALLLEHDVLEANLRRMARRAAALGVALRPHIKTHKCLEIAHRQRELGARGLTVSTLDEARVFAEAGFDDLTWAFPLILGRAEEARELARRICLRLTVDSADAVAALEALDHPFHVWLEVDCGDHRSGVPPDSAQALDLAQRLAGSGRLIFDGLLTHSGQAYHAHNRDQLAAVAETERRVLAELAERLRHSGVPIPAVSVGSTPAMAVAEDLTGVTEARPGNYAFYDYTQVSLGSCRVEDCAVTVLASVVSSPPSAAHSVVDAGALALSKDTGPTDGSGGLGRLFTDVGSNQLHPEARVTAVSQEHGILNQRLPVGSRVRILPNHSCLTAACFDGYWVVRDGVVTDRWTIWRGRSA